MDFQPGGSALAKGNEKRENVFFALRLAEARAKIVREPFFMSLL